MKTTRAKVRPSRETDGQDAAHLGGAQLVGSAPLHFRLGAPADLERCAELLPPGFRAPAPVQRDLTRLWARILAGEARAFAVIEDLEMPHPAGIEGFGLSVFVSDAFVDEFCASPQPQLSALFYERLLADEAVVLTPEHVAAANATTGINILVLHFGLRHHDLSDVRTAQVLAVGSAAFFFFHGGYRVRSIINEVYGGENAAYMSAGGFRLVSDFQKRSPETFAGVPPDQYPYLFMLRREWVEPAAVNPLTQLFFAPAPRIGFSTTERRVLERALLNQSDEAIARGLSTTEDAVKKTWRNIHERVDRNASYLLPERHRASAGGRGQEKRPTCWSISAPPSKGFGHPEPCRKGAIALELRRGTIRRSAPGAPVCPQIAVRPVQGVRSSASTTFVYGILASSFSRRTSVDLSASNRHMQRPSSGANVDRM